jgi:hypothetical protein
MSLAIVRDAEREGYFRRAATGDARGAGLFARYIAWRLNPSGDPASWGALRKTGGGHHVEGYAEDAIVFGADPDARRNVIDLIAGAGAPGARVQWSDWLPRRESDVWERPVPLTEEQIAYLRMDAVPTPGPTPTPAPPPPPSPPPILDELATIKQMMLEIARRLEAIEQSSAQAATEARHAAARASDLLARPTTCDWPEYVGAVTLPGLLGGPRTITMRPRPRQE